MSTAAELLTNREYKYGFVTDIETETIARGLSEDTVRLISSKKNEPEWMLEWRLGAFRRWLLERLHAHPGSVERRSNPELTNPQSTNSQSTAPQSDTPPINPQSATRNPQ